MTAGVTSSEIQPVSVPDGKLPSLVPSAGAFWKVSADSVQLELVV